MSVSCSLEVTCWKRADLLALFYVMFPCVLSLTIRCPGSGEVNDCIASAQSDQCLCNSLSRQYVL